MRNSKIISRLLFKYLQGILTPEEELKLELWKNQSSENRQFLEELSKDAMPAKEMARDQLESRRLRQRIFSKINAQVPELQTPVVHMKTRWWKYAGAAAVLVLFCVGILSILIMRKDAIEKPFSKVENRHELDVSAPEENFATITLANGQKVNLNSSANGMLTSQGNMKVIKSADGSVIYKSAAGSLSKEVQIK